MKIILDNDINEIYERLTGKEGLIMTPQDLLILQIIRDMDGLRTSHREIKEMLALILEKTNGTGNTGTDTTTTGPASGTP